MGKLLAVHSSPPRTSCWGAAPLRKSPRHRSRRSFAASQTALHTSYTFTERMSGVERYFASGSAGELGFFASQPSWTVALEACGGAHYLARQLAHQVRLIPPACWAISRPIMITSDTDPSLNGAQQLTLAHRCRQEGVHPIINLQGRSAGQCSLCPR
jgi:hypothetical protein